MTTVNVEAVYVVVEVVKVVSRRLETTRMHLDRQKFTNLNFRICFLLGEFDPGSERTLAACLTHASRARKFPSGSEYSGARVSNT